MTGNKSFQNVNFKISRVSSCIQPLSSITKPCSFEIIVWFGVNCDVESGVLSTAKI